MTATDPDSDEAFHHLPRHYTDREEIKHKAGADALFRSILDEIAKSQHPLHDAGSED